MNILGPFPKATSHHEYLFVMVDYFTKWIEIEAVAFITAGGVRKFIWKNIITRFGVPRTMLFDNRRSSIPPNLSASTSRPVSRSLPILKPMARPKQQKRSSSIACRKNWARPNKWVDELHGVLWSLRTTEKTTMGENAIHIGVWVRSGSAC